MNSKPLITVVGADGFVGGHLAAALEATKVVYRPAQAGEVHIGEAEGLLRKTDVIVNAAGFRIRPGFNFDHYQHSHKEATAALVQFIRPGALFLHVSSASVLGKSKDKKLGNHTQPDPASFPAPDYARAKLEADKFLVKAASEKGFRLVFMRPSNLYAPEGEGMIRSLLRLANRGLILRLYPRDGRHHFCDVNLFAEAVHHVIYNGGLPQSTTLVVADPYTVTNRELEEMIRRHLRRRTVTLPLPLSMMSTFLRHSIRARNPMFDWVTRGEIFGLMNLDSVYDPFETFNMLGMDTSRYSLERSLEPVIQKGLQE